MISEFFSSPPTAQAPRLPTNWSDRDLSTADYLLVISKKPGVDWPRTGLTGKTTTIKPWNHQGTE
ncbi:hypothetical protein C4J83_3364 [Pseudomonas sp. LBUM920]|nr:hypothetical protein C4J83_3364 [Pseudomonas sp. LBUM920]